MIFVLSKRFDSFDASAVKAVALGVCAVRGAGVVVLRCGCDITTTLCVHTFCLVSSRAGPSLASHRGVGIVACPW
jgi:hypothetical protein